MDRFSVSLLYILIMTLVAACSDDASIPTATDHELTASGPGSHAKPSGGSTGDTNSWASITFVDDPAMRMVSDKLGSYEDGKQSVHAAIMYYDPARRGGSLFFDPDKNRSSVARKVKIKLEKSLGVLTLGAPSPTDGMYEVGPYFDLRTMMQITELDGTPEAGYTDQWIAGQYGADHRFSKFRLNPDLNSYDEKNPDYSNDGFPLRLSGMDIPNCERILFHQVKITRTDGVFDTGSGKWDINKQGVWVVETVPDEAGDHRAVCQYPAGKNTLKNGAVYSIPFKMTIQEKRSSPTAF